MAEFEPYFAGFIVRAEAPLARVARTHTTEAAQPHWLWGQFHRFCRQLLEIALGSFVANLLAVAIALFSLQVYDRVIPHQSKATLWVLAAGATLALLMERVLGARSDLRGQSPSMQFNAMREFGSVRAFFTASTIGAIADIPVSFLFLILVASTAGNVVWVPVAGGLLLVIPGFFLQKRMLALTQETQGSAARSSRLLRGAIFERDTVKTQRAEGRVMRLRTELTTLSAMKSSEQRQLASILTFWSEGMHQVTYVAAVIVGTYLVFTGQFTVGSITAVGILTGRTLGPLTQLAGTLARWGNVRAALDFEGLGNYVRAHQKGLDLDILDGGAGLSIGQRQFIGWARLWLQDPAICLLDEPTAALDQTPEADLVGRLHLRRTGRTAVIATHRVPILALTTRSLV